MNRNHTICIIGTGYVGMASAIGFAELGHRVTGYDIITERIRALAAGTTPYYEDGIEMALRKHLDAGRISFHESLEDAVRDARFVVIAVGTPSRDDGSADVRAVEAAIDALAPLVAEDTVCILRSTVPPGTTERLAERCRFDLIFAPEFLREGSAVSDFLNPDRIVIGAESLEAATEYAELLRALDRPVLHTATRDAELIKVSSNAFLALKISFANEIANLCDAVGADALEVLRGVGHDRRIGQAFLGPGIGFGGPCFDKDVRGLAHVAGAFGSGSELLEATLRVNHTQPHRIVDLLESELGGLAGRHIAVWGLAFKGGTDDVRDSLALRIIDDLIARGAAPLAYDPAVTGTRPEIRCKRSDTALGALRNADALLVLTDWPQFRQIAPWAIAERLRGDVVVDGRNLLDPDAIAAAGLRYRGVGRRRTPALPVAAAS